MGADTIREALAFTRLPIAMGQYTGQAPEYLVMNFSTIPTGYADDAPSAEKQLWQLHLFCPMTRNVQGLMREIKHALYQAGFTFPSVISDADEKGQHLIFEFEGMEWI